MKRKRIAEINNWALEPANYPSLEPDTSEIAEIAALALRATDPDMVMVPRELPDEAKRYLHVAQAHRWDAETTWRTAVVGAAQEDQP